jgi:uncharacterized protein (TIGR04442 family)
MWRLSAGYKTRDLTYLQSFGKIHLGHRMIKDIRLHGGITNEIEFFANLAGEKPLATHFYETEENEDGKSISFFLAGNYVTLTPKLVKFSGNGGIISEYMFGSPLPLNDLSHKEILNRLLFFGTYQGEEGLSFTSNMQGDISYTNLFLEGNALSNSFFLIKTGWPYSSRRTQEVLLRLLGHFLKRTSFAGLEDDDTLSAGILKELSDPNAILLLIRLRHKQNSQFYKFVHRHYTKKQIWNEEDDYFITKFADEINVETYQRKRIAIDILYKSPVNRSLVDEYKDILAGSLIKPFTHNDIARLNSLRNLAMRHNLPLALFDSLDNLIPRPKAPEIREKESPYLKEMRSIFEGLFLESRRPRDVIGKEEIAKLIRIKHESQIQRDNGFEHILLDTGRILDEKTAETEDFEAFELFTEIVTYFDRLDNAVAVINHLAFLEGAEIAEDKIRSLLGNKKELDSLDQGLFPDLVENPAVENPYTLRFGKKKVEALISYLAKIEKGEQTLGHAVSLINLLSRSEKAHDLILRVIKDIFRHSYFDLNRQSHINLLKKEVMGVIKKSGGATRLLPEGAFESALKQFVDENEYMTSVFPRVLLETNYELRENFIIEKGIDRSRIEEIEKEYNKTHGLEEGYENGQAPFSFDEFQF